MLSGQEILQLKLMSYKNKGKTYIRAYRNKWVPATPEEAEKGSKGRSVPDVQIQVGVLQPDSRVQMGKKFLTLHPEFSNQDWYYLNHDLVDENTFFENLPDDAHDSHKTIQPVGESFEDDDDVSKEQVDENEDDVSEKKEPNHKFFLPTYALKGLAIQGGIVATLQKVFGSKLAEQWISFAIYQIMEGGSADCYSDWAYHQILPRTAQNLSGQDITKLLRTCDSDKWDQFWVSRFKTLQSQTTDDGLKAPIRYCAIDSTSINSYSSAEQVEYGHAKQDEGLPQINLATVLDQVTGHIVYAFVYNGSINDRASYAYIYERMKMAGFPMDQLMLVTDRGYPSNAMLNTLINDNSAFLTGCPIAANSSEEKWILGPGRQLDGMAHARDYVHKVFFHTKVIQWRKSNGTTAKVYSHLYFDPEHATAAKYSLIDSVLKVLDDLKKGQKVDQRSFQEARPYIKEIPDPKGSIHQKIKKIWAIDQDAIDRTVYRLGWLNIKSNVIEDASVAIELYRLRGVIEQGFDQMKNQLPGRRLRVTEASHLGKLFAFLLACDLRLQIRHNLWRQQNLNPNRKMELPGNSINKLLASMNRYTVFRNRSCEPWLLDLLPKKVRDWLTCLFRVEVPPKKFRS